MTVMENDDNRCRIISPVEDGIRVTMLVGNLSWSPRDNDFIYQAPTRSEWSAYDRPGWKFEGPFR